MLENQHFESQDQFGLACPYRFQNLQTHFRDHGNRTGGDTPANPARDRRGDGYEGGYSIAPRT